MQRTVQPKPIQMKKTLLALGVLLAASYSQAQVTTFVLEPEALSGALEFTWPSWGQTPDLNDPAEQVIGTAVFVDDGNVDPVIAQQGCNPLTNGVDVAGKIALVRRGTCEFGVKALNAENAGAIAVVIVNNQPGAPIAMGAGANGGNVTIPVVMITQEAGNALEAEVNAGNVVMLIGSVFGVYEYNLFTGAKQANISRYSAMPGPLATADGFNVNMGSWIKNFGSATQDNITLRGVVTQNGTEVYNNVSAPATLALGDSAFFALPLFSQSSYNGLYEFTYSINSPNEDDFPSDNSFSFNFLADSLVAYARVDPATKFPIPDSHVRAADGASFMACTYFRHPNASSYRVDGIYTSSARSGGASVDGDVLEARVYEWNDNFSGWSDAAVSNIVQQPDFTTDYFYTENLAATGIYIPLVASFPLVNNQRYLFCSYSPAEEVFLGFGDVLNYERIQADNDQPIYLANNGAEWLSFSNADHTAVGIRMVSIFTGIDERERVDITPYPNPTTDFLQIPLNGHSGAATLQIFDLAGAKVGERRVSVGGDQVLTMDLNGLANGTYVFQMNFDGGKFSTFRVVVSK